VSARSLDEDVVPSTELESSGRPERGGGEEIVPDSSHRSFSQAPVLPGSWRPSAPPLEPFAESETFAGGPLGTPRTPPPANGQDRSSRPRVVMPSLMEEPTASASPQPRMEPMVRPRTQVGLGPGGVDMGSELPVGTGSQGTSTVRETPEARAEAERVAEGKVIPFPAHRREDEDDGGSEPPPGTDPLGPMVPVPVTTAPYPPAPYSELKPTVREPLAGRSEPVPAPPAPIPAPGPGPGQTVHLPAAPVVGVSSSPVTANPPMSTSHDDSPPSSSRSHEPASSRAAVSGSSEDLFFRAGEEGRYEGGPSSIPPSQQALSDSVNEPPPPIRTPEQEERRARFIRWVVLAMGFGIAISLMGIVLRKVAPPQPDEVTADQAPPAPVEPTPVAAPDERPVIVPPPPAAEPAPPPASAEAASKEEAVAPARADEAPAPPREPSPPPVVKAPGPPKALPPPPPAPKRPPPVAGPKPEPTPAPKPATPPPSPPAPAPTATAAFPID
jgi:hypothetical protein